jgi:hypothetical protein
MRPFAEGGFTSKPGLEQQARSWPTPAARDWKSGEASDKTLQRNARPLNEIAVRWPTPAARDGDPRRGPTSPESNAWKRKVERGAVNRAGMLSDDLSSSAAAWPTPQAYSAGESNRPGITPLDGAARRWPTPTEGDAKSSGLAAYQAAGAHRPGTTLTDAAVRRQWPTPTAVPGTGYMSGSQRDMWRPTLEGAACGARPFRPDPTTPKDGPRTSRRTRVLNPRFVEALMGWPIGWTDCGFSGTASAESRPRSPSQTSGNASTEPTDELAARR